MKPEEIPSMASRQSRPLLDSNAEAGAARRIKIERIQMEQDENLLAFQPETMEPDGFLVNIGEFKRNYEVV
jgi:hypothetical protein